MSDPTDKPRPPLPGAPTPAGGVPALPTGAGGAALPTGRRASGTGPLPAPSASPLSSPLSSPLASRSNRQAAEGTPSAGATPVSENSLELVDEDEAALVRAAARGDRQAWAALMTAHAPRICAYLGARVRRPEVVELLLENTVYHAWRKIGDCDPRRFAAWLRKQAAALALDWHQKNKHESLQGRFPVERCGADRAQADRMRRLEEALGKLSEQHRMALEQRFRGFLEGQALSEALHRDQAGVDKLLDEALTALEQAVRPEDLPTGEAG